MSAIDLSPVIIRHPIHSSHYNNDYTAHLCELDDKVRKVVRRGISDSWLDVSQAISMSSSSGNLIRFIADGRVPRRVLWASSYDADNVMQVNIDLRASDTYVELSDEYVTLCHKMGLMTEVVLYPIIPGSVTSDQVISTMDRYKAFTNLVFRVIYGVGADIATCNSSYLDLISTSDSHHENTTVVSSYFRERFQHYTDLFAEPHGIKVVYQ